MIEVKIKTKKSHTPLLTSIFRCFKSILRVLRSPSLQTSCKVLDEQSLLTQTKLWVLLFCPEDLGKNKTIEWKEKNNSSLPVRHKGWW